MMAKQIVLTITSDTNYDQRMIRICTSLQAAGYVVTLLGRLRPGSKTLIRRSFHQIRIPQRIDSGKLFYLTYNLKLFWKLLFIKADAFCAIDLDTILPVYYAARLRGIKRVYDAHELFCEIEEVVQKPAMQKIWRAIERHTVPHFPHGYTVNESYVQEYQKMYRVQYAIVRNAAVLEPIAAVAPPATPVILYQGAVNKGRCFEQLIPAMKAVPAQLIICGEGNFLEEAKALAHSHGLTNKITFEGYVAPDALRAYTLRATIGITLFVATSRSNELSLANRFFDYMHACVPQLCVDYPEYAAINSQFEIAVLLRRVTPETIAQALNEMLEDHLLYARLKKNCAKAREVYCWQQEEKRLLDVYQKLFAGLG